jgi:hypothetical protein
METHGEHTSNGEDGKRQAENNNEGEPSAGRSVDAQEISPSASLMEDKEQQGRDISNGLLPRKISDGSASVLNIAQPSSSTQQMLQQPPSAVMHASVGIPISKAPAPALVGPYLQRAGSQKSENYTTTPIPTPVTTPASTPVITPGTLKRRFIINPGTHRSASASAATNPVSTPLPAPSPNSVSRAHPSGLANILQLQNTTPITAITSAPPSGLTNALLQNSTIPLAVMNVSTPSIRGLSTTNLNNLPAPPWLTNDASGSSIPSSPHTLNPRPVITSTLPMSTGNTPATHSAPTHLQQPSYPVSRNPSSAIGRSVTKPFTSNSLSAAAGNVLNRGSVGTHNIGTTPISSWSRPSSTANSPLGGPVTASSPHMGSVHSGSRTNPHSSANALDAIKFHKLAPSNVSMLDLQNSAAPAPPTPKPFKFETLPEPLPPSECPLLSVFYAEFDNTVGPKVCFDAPHNFMQKDIAITMTEARQALCGVFSKHQVLSSPPPSSSFSSSPSRQTSRKKEPKKETDGNKSEGINGAIPRTASLRSIKSDDEAANENDGSMHPSQDGSETPGYQQPQEMPIENTGIFVIENIGDGNSLQPTTSSSSQNTSNKTVPAGISVLDDDPVNVVIEDDPPEWTVFDAISDYIFTQSDFFDKMLCVSTQHLHILTLPTKMSDAKRYERNSLLFAVGFVLRADVDAWPFRPALHQLVNTFKMMELETQFLCNPRTRLTQMKPTLEAILISLNSAQGEVNLMLDPANHLNLRLFCPPSRVVERVPDHVVPVLLKPEWQLQTYAWDLTINWIIPQIDGFSHAKRIAQESEMDREMCAACLQVLKQHGAVALLDIFRYSNLYEPTPLTTSLLQDCDGSRKLLQMAYLYVGKSSSQTSKARSASTGKAPSLPVLESLSSPSKRPSMLRNQSGQSVGLDLSRSGHSGAQQQYNNGVRNGIAIPSGGTPGASGPVPLGASLMFARHRSGGASFSPLPGGGGLHEERDFTQARSLGMGYTTVMRPSSFGARLPVIPSIAANGRSLGSDDNEDGDDPLAFRSASRTNEGGFLDMAGSLDDRTDIVAPSTAAAAATDSTSGSGFSPLSYPPRFATSTSAASLFGTRHTTDQSTFSMNSYDAHMLASWQEALQLPIHQQAQVKAAMAQLFASCQRTISFGELLVSKMQEQVMSHQRDSILHMNGSGHRRNESSASEVVCDNASNKEPQQSRELENNETSASAPTSLLPDEESTTNLDWAMALEWMDHRRLVTFGLIHGLIRRVHRFPVAHDVLGLDEMSGDSSDNDSDNSSRRCSDDALLEAIMSIDGDSDNQEDCSSHIYERSPSDDAGEKEDDTFSEGMLASLQSAGLHYSGFSRSIDSEDSYLRVALEKQDAEDEPEPTPEELAKKEKELALGHDIAQRMDGYQCDDELTCRYEMSLQEMVALVEGTGRYEVSYLYCAVSPR